MKAWKLWDKTTQSTEIVVSGNSKRQAWMQELERHQGTAGEAVSGRNLIEMIETENRNNIREKTKEKRFLGLNRAPIFKLEGPVVC